MKALGVLLWGPDSPPLSPALALYTDTGAQYNLLPQPCPQRHTAGRLEEEERAFLPPVAERTMISLFARVPCAKKCVCPIPESVLKFKEVNILK